MELETLTKKRRRSHDPPAAGPRWVMLSPSIITRDSSNSSLADAKTTAASCTSSDQSFSISCGALAPPPATSSFYCQWLGSAPNDGNHPGHEDRRRFHVVAAHDDVVLIQICLPIHKESALYPSHYHYDHFLYETGAGRPPLLSLLPSCYKDVLVRLQDPIPTRRVRSLDSKSTGVLRRGEGKIQIVQMELGYDHPAELCVLRHGREWVIKQVPITHHHGEEVEVRQPQVEAVIPVGNRFLCWVDYHRGFYLCDMAKNKKDPKLQYVPLPALAHDDTRGDPRDFHRPQDSLNLAAAGPDAVRFVIVAPRCCCGGRGKTSCERSSTAFNVTTWTMNVRNAEATWVKERVVDCDELWHQLPSYGGFQFERQLSFENPIVSADDPDVIWFTVHHTIVEVNTRSKAALLSVVSSLNFCSGFGDCHLRAKLRW